MFKKIFFSNLKRPPIWMMRQAGRYLPEYRRLRKKEKNFLDLCFNSKLATKISLQPISRFDLDAIILFSDILVIPFALGQDVKFKNTIGPILKPISNVDQFKCFEVKQWKKKLLPVFKTIQNIKKNSQKSLIGFAGSPFTLLTYILEGGSSKNHHKTKTFLLKQEKETDKIINLLIKITLVYLKEQIKAGVDVIQIFESWASVLEKELYDKYIIEPNKIICKELKKEYPDVPIIFFPKGSGEKYLEVVKKIPCDGLSLDLNYPDELLKICKQRNVVVQGNLDPIRLLVGGRQMESKILEILKKFSNNKFIFNLSHGILPETPIKNVFQMIKTVRQYYDT